MLATQRENETAMAAPIRRDVGDRSEAMRDTVVELIFVLVLFTRKKGQPQGSQRRLVT